MDEADPIDPSKVVRRKLKVAAKEVSPAAGESKVLKALEQPDLRVQKEKKRPSKASAEAGKPCFACGTGLNQKAISNRLLRAKLKIERLKDELEIRQ